MQTLISTSTNDNSIFHFNKYDIKIERHHQTQIKMIMKDQ